MKYLPLVWAGVWRKPVRTIFTLSSVVVAFVLFGVLQGVDASVEHVEEVSRLDQLLVDSKFGPKMPIAYLDQIARVPGVTVVAPRDSFFGYWRDPKNGVAIAMIDERFFAVRPEITATPEQIDAWRRSRTGVFVGVDLADRMGWKVGDRIPITTTNPDFAQKDGDKVWTFTVQDIISDTDHPGQSVYLFGNYDYFDQARATNNGMINRILVRIKDPRQGAQISAQIDQLFANSSVPTRTQPEKTEVQSTSDSTFDIGLITKAVLAAVFFSLLFVTGNTMMQSVRERIPEFAVLKTIGFSDGRVLALVLGESLATIFVGAAVGLCLVPLFMPLVADSMGPAFSHIPPIVAAYAFCAALLTALASGVPPAWRARRLVIVDALAGRGA